MRRLLTLLEIFVTTTTAKERMSHYLFVKVGIKITMQEEHFNIRTCAAFASFYTFFSFPHTVILKKDGRNLIRYNFNI